MRGDVNDNRNLDDAEPETAPLSFPGLLGSVANSFSAVLAQL
jgi:hypothetical protein